MRAASPWCTLGIKFCRSCRTFFSDLVSTTRAVAFVHLGVSTAESTMLSNIVQNHLAVLTVQAPVSRKILRLEMDVSSLITMTTIVFSMLKITRGLKIIGPRWCLPQSCRQKLSNIPKGEGNFTNKVHREHGLTMHNHNLCLHHIHRFCKKTSLTSRVVQTDLPWPQGQEVPTKMSSSSANIQTVPKPTTASKQHTSATASSLLKHKNEKRRQRRAANLFP